MSDWADEKANRFWRDWVDSDPRHDGPDRGALAALLREVDEDRGPYIRFDDHLRDLKVQKTEVLAEVRRVVEEVSKEENLEGPSWGGACLDILSRLEKL